MAAMSGCCIIERLYIDDIAILTRFGNRLMSRILRARGRAGMETHLPKPSVVERFIVSLIVSYPSLSGQGDKVVRWGCLSTQPWIIPNAGEEQLMPCWQEKTGFFRLLYSDIAAGNGIKAC